MLSRCGHELLASEGHTLSDHFSRISTKVYMKPRSCRDRPPSSPRSSSSGASCTCPHCLSQRSCCLPMMQQSASMLRAVHLGGTPRLPAVHARAVATATLCQRRWCIRSVDVCQHGILMFDSSLTLPGLLCRAVTLSAVSTGMVQHASMHPYKTFTATKVMVPNPSSEVPSMGRVSSR